MLGRSPWVPYAAAGALYLLALLPFLPFRVDDAYISFVYARNFVAGNGLTYNGVVVEGYSNFLWVLLLTPFLGLGLDPLLAARALSAGSGCAAILLMLRLCRRALGGADHRLPLIATGTVAVLAPVTAWTMGGLETILVSLLVVLLITNEWGDRPRFQGLSPLLLLMIALTRPEGAGLLPIWLVHRLLRGARLARLTGVESLAFLGLFSLFLLWRWRTYGHLLPNPAYLKLGMSLATTLDAAGWLLSFFALRPAFGILLVIGIVISTVRVFRGEKSLALPLGLTAGFFAFVLLAGRDWMPHHRFLAPVVPLMALFVVVSLDRFRKVILRGSMAALALVAIGFELIMAWTVYRPLTVEFGRFMEGLVQAGEWIERETPRSATIAVVDAGVLAFYGERATIDILGLNDEHIAHSPTKSDAAYVFGHRPDLIQLHVEVSESGGLLPEGDAIGNREIMNHPLFHDCYALDSASQADPFYPFLFFRTCNGAPGLAP
jgi:hypothetical protein